MQHRINIGDFHGDVWPEPEVLSHCILTKKGIEELQKTGNDNWGLGVDGLYRTEHLPPLSWKTKSQPTRVQADLQFWIDPDLGILLYYTKSGGGYSEYCLSKGDMMRLHSWVRTLHGDLRPVGLYIPFDRAWAAIREFMEREGELPQAIEWVDARNIPPGTFPDPWEHPEIT